MSHQLPEPYGYIVDGDPDGIRFKKNLTTFDEMMRSTMPVFSASQLKEAIASVKREPLSDEQIDQIHGHAYIALRAQGFNGGMGGLTWDRASARAIEQAHGIGAPIKNSLTTDSGEGVK